MSPPPSLSRQPTPKQGGGEDEHCERLKAAFQPSEGDRAALFRGFPLADSAEPTLPSRFLFSRGHPKQKKPASIRLLALIFDKFNICDQRLFFSPSMGICFPAHAFLHLRGHLAIRRNHEGKKKKGKLEAEILSSWLRLWVSLPVGISHMFSVV